MIAIMGHTIAVPLQPNIITKWSTKEYFRYKTSYVSFTMRKMKIIALNLKPGRKNTDPFLALVLYKYYWCNIRVDWSKKPGRILVLLWVSFYFGHNTCEPAIYAKHSQSSENGPHTNFTSIENLCQ